MPDTRETRKIMELQSLAGIEKFSKRTVADELDRRKIIELLCQATFGVNKQTIESYLIPSAIAEVADHLIANDVVLQKWISVTERLPKQGHYVLVIDRVTGEVTTAYLNDFGSFVFRDGRGHGARYWMPLPKPPKWRQSNET